MSYPWRQITFTSHHISYGELPLVLQEVHGRLQPHHFLQPGVFPSHVDQQAEQHQHDAAAPVPRQVHGQQGAQPLPEGPQHCHGALPGRPGRTRWGRVRSPLARPGPGPGPCPGPGPGPSRRRCICRWHRDAELTTALAPLSWLGGTVARLHGDSSCYARYPGNAVSRYRGSLLTVSSACASDHRHGANVALRCCHPREETLSLGEEPTRRRPWGLSEEPTRRSWGLSEEPTRRSWGLSEEPTTRSWGLSEEPTRRPWVSFEKVNPPPRC